MKIFQFSDNVFYLMWMLEMPALNERFGATAAGSADLKGSAEIPLLRQAAIPLCASGESGVERATV
jgi:hypothetical protein